MSEKEHRAVSSKEPEMASGTHGGVEVFFLQKDGVLLESRLLNLEARVQASVDLTDDLVAIAGNTVSVTEDRLDKTLNQADAVLDQAYFMVSTFLFIASSVIAIVGVVVTVFLSRHRNQMLKGAVEDIAKRIKKDDEFKREFIAALVFHEELRENINFAIDKVARELYEENGGGAGFATKVDNLRGQIKGSGVEVAKPNDWLDRLTRFWRKPR